MVKYYLSFVLIIACFSVQAQNEATFREYKKKYLTYSFSDPDPVASTKKIYPYFRFDGFTDKPVEMEWKVVLLENDYISVQIMPEIGGKVWTAKDKTSGKDFFYNNEVVKFRDIAMRGPWVSGGIEVNYGIIGHTPNSSTPVDYLVRANEDGSVSCYTSTLDLLTRTRWVLEIKLEKDKAYFTTRSFWFNSTGTEQPYYTWMNAGIPAGKDLKFLYPGSHSIGHGGEAKEWPIDDSGRDLSYYAENDFGGSKSYHILGTHSNYFGALWEGEDFGMIHYSKRGDKLGKKIFLWAQSEQGRIWEDLLTDDSGQYVEIQSGRLFNQNQFQSSFTPFKQIGFMPYSSDSWTEYWYPFKGIEGFTDANLIGAFNVENSGKFMTIRISPIQFINDSLQVYNTQGNIIATAFVKGEPLKAVELEVRIPDEEEVSKIELKGHTLHLSKETDKQLSRPLEMEAEFQEDAAYGLYLQGRDLARFRDYQRAETKIKASLEQDPLFLPALVEMAKLKLFRMQYDSAFYYSQKALSIDTYDGEANYYYGMAASELSLTYDALDGYEVATLTPQFRHAAYTALSHEYMRRNELIYAKDNTVSSLKSNPRNIDALQVLYILARIYNDGPLLEEVEDKIKELNPINHFLRFEAYFQSPSDENKEKFTGLIRNEMPIETFLELAIWYANLGRVEESKKVLELSPQNSETLFWQAWLNREEDTSLSKEFLRKAGETSPDFVFPFRQETAKVLEWAADEVKAWQTDYLLALIYDYRGHREEALSRLKIYDEKIDFAPFYLLRARLYDPESVDPKLKDINLATEINPEEWRYGIIRSGILMQLQRDQEALETLKSYYNADRSNYIVGLSLVEMLIRNQQYQEAEEVLATLHVLPFEGATDARRYYRETKLMLAHKAIEEENYEEALTKIEEAEEWPNRLGVGAPYPELINNDLEDWMKSLIFKNIGKDDLYQEYLNKVNNKEIHEESYVEMIQSITSKADKRIF